MNPLILMIFLAGCVKFLLRLTYPLKNYNNALYNMSKLHDFFSRDKKGGAPRPLRVGEEIRHALADIFMRGECHAPGLSSASITVSEVRVSPDLKNATAFFMPLAGANKEEFLKVLIEAAPEIRHLVSKRVRLRHAPKIYFALDHSFDEAQRINTILNRPEVAKDLKSDNEAQKPEI